MLLALAEKFAKIVSFFMASRRLSEAAKKILLLVAFGTFFSNVPTVIKLEGARPLREDLLFFLRLLLFTIIFYIVFWPRTSIKQYIGPPKHNN